MSSAQVYSGRSPQEHTIRIVIADRDRMTSQLLVQSFAQDRRFQAVMINPSADILDFVSARPPHVLVVSSGYESLKLKGFQLCRRIKARHPQLNLLILLDAPEREPVLAAFRAGATGVFSRTEPLSTLHARVERVSQGELSVGTSEAAHLLEHFRNRPSFDVVDRGSLDALTARELEIAELVVQGQTNGDIARQLRLSHHTVKNYLFRIFEKLQVSNRVELLFTLLDQGKHVANPGLCSRAAVEKSFEAYLAAAKGGFALAAFVVGLAYLECYGVPPSADTAYYWLRYAEKNSRDIEERCSAILHKLRSTMNRTDVEHLEERVTADAHNEPLLEAKVPAELMHRAELMNLGQAG